MEVDEKGDVCGRIVYAYDPMQQLIESRGFNSSDELMGVETYVYTLDGNSNWIRRITYLNDEPVKITEREIIY